jgi:DNA-binding PadR family transcriptional regulator
MAKKRKVGNLMALAVLSAVTQRPMHPYEMASMLRARGKDQDMPIKWGSLYTVVQNLEKHGFLEAAENVRDGGRPERTVYRITEAGTTELKDWVRELVSTPEKENLRFEIGLSVLGALGPDEAIELLRQRVSAMEQHIAAERTALTAESQQIPRLFLVESEYALAIREAELAWIRQLLAEFSDGSFPGVDQWRSFHTTGEVPAELAELSERGATPDV